MGTGPPTPGRPTRALAWSLRAAGGVIALVQGVYLPIFVGPAAVSPVALAVAAALAGVAEGVARDARRRK